MITVKYRNDFNNGENIKFVTILSITAKSKNEYLPILNLSFKFFWYLLIRRIRGKIYFLITTNKTDSSYVYDFIRIKKDKKWWYKFERFINKI